MSFTSDKQSGVGPSQPKGRRSNKDAPLISAGGIVERANSGVPQRWRLRVALLIVAVVATFVLFGLREHRRPGGDTDFAQEIAAEPFDVFYVRSPLTIYLHQAAYHFIFKPLGLTPADAVGFCSSVAGGLFVATLVAISQHWLFLLFNLSAPLMLIFCGHVEHYAWVNALLTVSFLAVKRHLETQRPLWPAVALALLAASSHMLAVFYAPAFLYLTAARHPTRRRWDWRLSLRDREISLILVIVWAVWFCGSQLVFRVGGLDNGLQRLVPLRLPDEEARHLFSLFSWAHLKMWLLFHWKSSPLGLGALILLGWTIRTRFEKFLLLATACGFFWTWMWHPDRAERDWDLFANLALPLNLLVGLLLARLLPSRSEHEASQEEGRL